MENVRGKVAVVTGAASGIGRATAERFLAEGMSVVLADVEAAALRAAAGELGAAGDVEAVVTDVSDPAAVEALAGKAVARFGTVHVVGNNAGVGGHLRRLWETPLEDFGWVVDVNLWGVIHGIRTFVPILVEQGEGHVVNTASLAAWSGAPTLGSYGATKHAVLALSESLRAPPIRSR
jgi:NADP-dependent 3-hydroxy acid dehydrogenase YdfG